MLHNKITVISHFSETDIYHKALLNYDMFRGTFWCVFLPWCRKNCQHNLLGLVIMVWCWESFHRPASQKGDLWGNSHLWEKHYLQSGLCTKSEVTSLIGSASLPALVPETLPKLASSDFYLGSLPQFSFRLNPLQFCIFMGVLKKL